MTEHVLLLQKKELCLIGALMGASSLCGFSCDLSGTNKKSCIDMIHRLWKKKILESCDGNVVPVEEYRALFAEMFRAEFLLEIKPAEQNLPTVCIYSGEKTIVSETSAIKKDELKIRQLKKDTVMEYLQTNNYLPKVKEPLIDDADIWQSKAGKNAKPVLEIRLIETKGCKVKDTLSVCLLGVNYGMKRGENPAETYSEEKAAKILKEWCADKISEKAEPGKE